MDYSPRVEALKGKGAAAWDIHAEAMRARAAGEAVIAMSIGDPDLDTPSPVVERAVESLRAGDTHYSEMRGLAPLRAAVAERFRTAGGPPVTADEVVILAGAQNALFSTAQVLFGPGDEVILMDPAYATYEATLRAAGAEPVRVPARQDAPFRPDPQAVRAAVSPRTRGILLNTPSNPSGVAFTADELAALAGIAGDHDLWVVADEVYGALAFSRPHVPIAGLPGMAGRTVTVGSVSKSHAMTGWRVGWAIGPAAFCAHVERLSLAMLYGLPAFSQKAALLALADSAAIEAGMVATYRRRCALVADALERVPGLAVVRPEGGMFVMVNVAGLGIASIDFAWRLFWEERVAVLDGGAFGPAAAGYLRLSCAIAEEDLAEGCARIARLAGRIASEAAPRSAAAAPAQASLP